MFILRSFVNYAPGSLALKLFDTVYVW